jgi:hypothetical protein
LPADPIADVIQAIEGPVTVTTCSTDDSQCSSSRNAMCAIRCGVFGRILAALGDARSPNWPRCAADGADRRVAHEFTVQA